MTPFSVVIVGSGISALSTAWHLMAEGIEDIAIISDNGGEAAQNSIVTSGFISGGFIDNFTRFSHIYGVEQSKKFWAFADQSFESLKDFCQKQNISFLQNRRIRIISDQMELQECQQAVKEMNSVGITSSIEGAVNQPSKDIAQQIQEQGGAYCDTQALRSTLKAQLSCSIINKKLVRIESNGKGIKAHLKDGSLIQSQLIVLCNNLDIRSLVPELKQALIPVADQWISLKASTPTAVLELQNKIGTAFSLSHGNIWGCVTKQKTIHVGGARFLRKLAGIGLEKAEESSIVNSHLIKSCQSYFSEDLEQIGEATAFLDCRPCDELPIIGPMFGDDQILIATGYLGQNTSFGFFAGLNIARLIKEGVAAELPREFWPTRLRSIKQN